MHKTQTMTLQLEHVHVSRNIALFKNLNMWKISEHCVVYLTHCGRVTQICVFNTVNLGTSASSS